MQRTSHQDTPQSAPKATLPADDARLLALERRFRELVEAPDDPDDDDEASARAPLDTWDAICLTPCASMVGAIAKLRTVLDPKGFAQREMDEVAEVAVHDVLEWLERQAAEQADRLIANVGRARDDRVPAPEVAGA